MNWREYWKQSNPFDQFMCILMSVDGNVQNVKDGIGGDSPISRLEQHVEEMRALEPYLRRGSWQESMLFQSCEAEVVHVCNDEVVVVMSIGGDLVEQVYDSSQFTEIPKKGDTFEVRVQFTKLQSRERPEPEYEPRKNVAPLPRIF
jgi:hypothetical protein